jgi:hypothetical protein
MSSIAEILLAQIWNSRWLREPLHTSDGVAVRVVYPGVWSHGLGPDFTGAMLDIGGRLATGDVEIDIAPDGWVEHGHDRNRDFDSVILQVVARDADKPLARRSDGAVVPRISLLDYLPASLDEFPAIQGLRPLGAIGFDTCAPGPASKDRELIENVLRQAGDRRMNERVATVSGELAINAPGQVLYSRLLDALGFSRNREPMAEVAARLPYASFATVLDEHPRREREIVAAGCLLGVGGFLPLSPRDSAAANLEPERVGRIERAWREAGIPWHGMSISPGFWTLTRLRPAAHPVRRLLAMARLLAASSEPLLQQLVTMLRSENVAREVRRWIIRDNPYVGAGHGHELIVNVIVPFGIAYSGMADQAGVGDAAAELWSSLRAGQGNAVTKQTMHQICGEHTFRVTSARAEQGLIHIHRNGCSKLRCYECPIAHLALAWEADSTRTDDSAGTGKDDGGPGNLQT